MSALRLFVAGDDPPPPKRKSKQLPKFLTQTEAARLIDAAKAALDKASIGSKKYGICEAKVRARARDLFAIRFDLATGLRISELLALDVADVDLVIQTVRVRHGKGDKERVVPLPDAVVPFVRDWIGSRTVGVLIPNDFGGRMSRITMHWRICHLGLAAGISGSMHWHRCRHYYGTAIYELTGDIRVVQELLGHRWLSSTQVYTHCAPRRMLAAVNLLPMAGR